MPTPEPDLSQPLIQRHRAKQNMPDLRGVDCEADAHLQIIELQRAVLTLANACKNLQERVAVLEGP